MAAWRLLSLNSPVNLLCTRTLATTKNNVVAEMRRNIEKKFLPPKPKKPPNPYLLYFSSVRSMMEKEHPGMKYIDLYKIVAQEWAKIDPALKQKFQDQYNKEYAIYKQKLDEYNNSLTVEQQILVIKELMKKKSTMEKDQAKQKLVELGKPKRPLSAYFLFMQDKKGSKDPKISQVDWVKNISNEWNNMTMEEKDKYHKKAKQLLEKYNIEMKKWKENMIQEGHSDLLESYAKLKHSSDKHEE